MPCTRGAAIFLFTVSLADGFALCSQNLQYWRRFVRAALPDGVQVPVFALVGSRADKVKGADEKVRQLQAEANADSQLPPLAASFALDCRGREACASLRHWLVQQHDTLVAAAAPVPRACEAILAAKAAWESEQRAFSWRAFYELCLTVKGLQGAEEAFLRTATDFLHDAGELVALDQGAAAGIVVLEPTWLCSQLVGELLAPPNLHKRPELRKPLLSATELERATACAKGFGKEESPGLQLALLMCEIGLCFRLDAESDAFFFPVLLSDARPDGILLADALRRAGRRLLGATEHDVPVPGFFARLQVRAATRDDFRRGHAQKLLWRNGLLLEHSAAQVVVLRAMHEGRECVDVIVLAGAAGSPWAALTDALNLVRVVLEECSPGVASRMEEHVLGGAGLALDCDARASKPLESVVVASEASPNGEIIIGNALVRVADLLEPPAACGAASPVEPSAWWFNRPDGGLDEVKSMVWMVAEKTLVFGPYTPQGDLTAHMQLQDALPGDFGGAVEFAGSVKQDGEWGCNSLYNNRPFRMEMNRVHSSRDLEAKKEARARLKAGYGDVPCNDDQLVAAKKLFAQGEYKIAPARL